MAWRLIRRPGAVDEQGLHQGGTVGSSKTLLEELLHQGEGAATSGRRLAGPGFL
jgi:hypothetical protein